MSEAKPRIPAIGEVVSDYGKLVAIEDVTPPPKKVYDYIFEESEYVVSIETPRGIEVRKGVTYTAKDVAINVAKTQAGVLAPNVAVVTEKRVQRRYQPTAATNYRTPEFKAFAPLPYGSRAGLPDDVEVEIWRSDAPEGEAK